MEMYNYSNAYQSILANPTQVLLLCTRAKTLHPLPMISAHLFTVTHDIFQTSLGSLLYDNGIIITQEPVEHVTESESEDEEEEESD